MSSAQLKETLKTKFETGEFTAADLPAFFTVFSYLGNETEEIQEEVEGWHRIVELELVGVGSFWIQIESGRFSQGTGHNTAAHLRLKMDAITAAQIFTGEKDGETALNSGELKIAGDLPDAIRFYEILEMVLEEIEY